MRPVYYVVLQGSLSESVFIGERDKQEFVSLLAELKQSLGFSLHAFALLESQVHLIVRPSLQGINHMVSTLVAVHARQCDRRMHTGYIFADEYEAKRCYDDERIWPLIKHVHHLPVLFGHCHHPNLARWTSHMAYLGDPRYRFVDAGEMLDLFTRDRSQALKQYQSLTAQAWSALDIHGCFPEPAVATDKHGDEQTVHRPVTLDLIADFVCQSTGVGLAIMRGKGRGELVVEARRRFIAAAVIVFSFPVSEVAKYLQVHHSYVSRLTFPGSEASKVMAETAREMAISLQRLA